MDLREYWDFNDPEKSAIKFRQLLETTTEPGRKLEIKTQIARTLGLRRRFDEAHTLLDEVKAELDLADDRARTSYELERGRTFNSGGQKAFALESFTRARETEVVDLKIDALHMLAICAEPEEASRLNEEAIQLATSSDDPKAKRWLGSLLNNQAWTYHDSDRFDDALRLFSKALEFRLAQGDAHQIRIAEWSVARCYRSLGRIEEALKIQLKLAEGPEDGYVSEEIAENLLLLGKEEESAPWFAKAYLALSQDPYLREHEVKRLTRLEKLSAPTPIS